MDNLDEALQDLAVQLSVNVAELLAVASKDIPMPQRQKVIEMIENDLATTIVNTLYKTPALHSQKGIDHLKENLAEYSEKFARMFLRND